VTADKKFRDSGPEDIGAIEALYAAAFPGEDLLPLVRDLLDLKDGVISLVAPANGAVCGHIAFTICGIEAAPDKVALLAPLAVLPAAQKQGIGRALIQAGFERLERVGVDCVCVLGDPAYYGRFGFAREERIETPYPLPAEWRDAWQSVTLGDGSAALAGTLSVPAPWRQESLWR
jgi:putative acetyltransferase